MAVTSRSNRSGQPLQGGYQKTVPIQLDTSTENEENYLVPPDIEKNHVHAVYNTIAEHWSHTRYKSWPKVADFLSSLPHGSVVADLGMGNGKNVIAASRFDNIAYIFGSDISGSLVQVTDEKMQKMWSNRPLLKEVEATQKEDNSANVVSSESTSVLKFDDNYLTKRNWDLGIADCIKLPLRDEMFDASISIAVLHHISTEKRRIALLRECMRVLRRGGKFLIYAWAQEQEATGVSRHVFEEQDVLVAWHHKLPSVKKQDWSEEKLRALQDEQMKHGYLDREKNAIVYQRYCHVYVEGELERLFRDHLADIAEIEEAYLDTGNWCVRARRI